VTGRPQLLLNLAQPWGEADPTALAGRAVGLGFDGVGLADSSRLLPDCWVESERVLAGTSAVLAGPVVASLGLRHPATIAGALRTLEDHHPGRAFAVAGRGESSVHNEGLAVPSLRIYRDSLDTLRERLRADDGSDRLPGRLLGAASGPRTIAATVGALGGVLLDVGTDRGTVGRAVDLARADDRGTHVWLFVRALVVPDPADAASAAAPLLGSCAARMAAAPEWFGLDADELPLVRLVAGRHDYLKHGTEDAAAEVDDEAARLVRRRFLLVTSAAEVTHRVSSYAELGIDGLVVAGGLPQVVPGLPALAAALRAGLAVKADTPVALPAKESR
jgi:alkanesulfonate monooxygenase SsuD/methylene tetrahydromethanopterin reductase-like flavin-dependent oxidoreductase (luciferase family)